MYLTIGLNLTQPSNPKLREFEELVRSTMEEFPDVHPIETGDNIALVRKAAEQTTCAELKKLCDAIEFNEMKLFINLHPSSNDTTMAVEYVSYVVADLDLRSMRTAVKHTDQWEEWFNTNMPTSKVSSELTLFPVVVSSF